MLSERTRRNVRRNWGMDRLDEAGQSLVERHLRYASHLADARMRAIRSPWLQDELRSAAYLGLVEAARTFDPAIGVQFKTHAYLRIVGAMLDEARRTGSMGFGGSEPFVRGDDEAPGLMSLDARVGDDGDSYADRLDARDLPIGWETEWEDEVERLASLLPPDEGDVVRLLYLWADTAEQSAVASFLGLVSHTTVSKRHARATRKLRNYFRMKADHEEVITDGR